MNRTSIGRIVGAVVVLALLWCPAAEACSYPIAGMWGVADNFALPTDPIPYSPTALPQFVSFLNGNGIPTASMKPLDVATVNRHMVASLRHGMRSCFPGATSLTLCFNARALRHDPTDDTVTIYDTDFGIYSFPIVYTSPIAPTLTPTWTPGTGAFLCIDLTPQMLANQIGDMLQFHLEDDTAVDFITMTLN